jgi:hypothetical protein
MIGFIMLVGTVVNNPILIVEQALQNVREGGMNPRDAILDSVRTRIRPIFMTALIGLLGLLPLVISPGAGSELYRGLGSVTLGGLVFSTFFTLFFIPALFTVCMDAQSGLGRLFGRRPQAALATVGEPMPREADDREHAASVAPAAAAVETTVENPVLTSHSALSRSKHVGHTNGNGEHGNGSAGNGVHGDGKPDDEVTPSDSR